MNLIFYYASLVFVLMFVIFIFDDKIQQERTIFIILAIISFLSFICGKLCDIFDLIKEIKKDGRKEK